MLVVPALLMVSTIRFQSFRTFDLGMRRGYRGLFLVAAFIALLVTYPHEVLIVMAYSYFASGFVGTFLSKGRKLEPAADVAVSITRGARARGSRATRERRRLIRPAAASSSRSCRGRALTSR